MRTSGILPVIESLERVPSILLPLVNELPPEVRKRRPAPAQWSAHEHACHLAAVHPLFFQRLDLMLNEDHPVITPYDPDKDEDEGALMRMDLDAAMATFKRDRSRLVRRLRTLKNAEWDRTAEHGEYSRYSIFILFRHVAMHDMLHAYRIEELLLKKDW